MLQDTLVDVHICLLGTHEESTLLTQNLVRRRCQANSEVRGIILILPL